MENGSLSTALSENGREEVERSLTKFWNGWIAGERPVRETLPGSIPIAQPKLELDSSASTAWESFVGDKREIEAILVHPRGVLAQNGDVFDDQGLVDLVRWKLEQTLATTSGPSIRERAGGEKGSSAQDGGTWKKLGISSWGPSIGLGSGEGNTAEGSKGVGKETSSVKWGGIGTWFGMGPSTGSSGVSRSDDDGDRPVEWQVAGADRVDLVSLHSALESETGEDGSLAGSGWTIEKVWAGKGSEQVTLAYAIVSVILRCFAREGIVRLTCLIFACPVR